ncbi:MAG TPA: M67 family metallopeptidase [Thermoplasmata archaeon]|nr:M67 family metallopeptidase [Thermoplasmata archaeon]
MPRPLLATIEHEARASYPDEACGFLLSKAADADEPLRAVVGTEAAPNEVDGERRRRFVITAAGLRAAEARATARGEVVSGFYHSHPDHPARPSAFDTEHAWPWYTYVVVSVDRAGACDAGAFELAAEGGAFRRCELRLGADVPAPHTPGPLGRATAMPED